MNNIKKKLLSLILAAGMTASMLPASVFAENEKIQSEKISMTELNKLRARPSEYDEKYEAATLEEVMTELCGNYVFLNSHDVSYHSGSFSCIGDNGKIHKIDSYYTETVVKVKEDTSLPVEEIMSEAVDMGIKKPEINKDGDLYRITVTAPYQNDEENAMKFLLNKLADCDNVVSVKEHLAIYEDTANHVSLEGVYVGKTKLSDETMGELLLKLAPLGAKEDTSSYTLDRLRKTGYRYNFVFDYDLINKMNDKSAIYDLYKYLDESGLSYSTLSYQTCLAMAEPEVYFCSKEYPLGKKYDVVKKPSYPTGEEEAQGEDLSQLNFKLNNPDEELEAAYKSATLDEVFDKLCGNHVDLSSHYGSELFSAVGQKQLFKIDESGRIHIIYVRGAETVVKVKEDTELPLKDLLADIKVDGYNSLSISRQDNIYRIKNSPSKEIMDKIIEKLRTYGNVISIDEHFAVYEDTKNYSGFSSENSIYIEGKDIPEEELLEKLAAFDPSELTDDTYIDYLLKNDSELVFRIGENRQDDPTEYYKAVKYLADNNIGYRIPSTITELAVLKAEVFYCNRPCLINGMEGDANADGQLDMSDAVMIMQSLANPNKYGVKAAKGITAQGIKNGDADNNGLTTNDALEVQKKLLGL